MKTPVYFPIERFNYDIGPGIKPLGTSFGNAGWDDKIFHVFDFQNYLNNKIECLKERPSKYIQVHRLDPLTESNWVRKISEQLKKEWPEHFDFHTEGDTLTFQSKLVNSKLVYDLKSRKLISAKIPALNSVNEYQLNSALDFLALHMTEDISILQKSPEGENFISYLHLCGPSHWAAEDKIGKSFDEIHSPVPGIEKMLKASKAIVDAMVNKGPFVRFIWSFVTDTRLNHHPIAPAGINQDDWKGRSFNLEAKEPFYLRIERQTTSGDPESNSSLFTIGLSFIPGSQVKANADWNAQLAGALKSMTPESRVYKGVSTCFDDLLGYLEN